MFFYSFYIVLHSIVKSFIFRRYTDGIYLELNSFLFENNILKTSSHCFKRVTIFNNITFYRYGGHIELLGFKEYYGMPRGHEHDPMYSHQYLRALSG